MKIQEVLGNLKDPRNNKNQVYNFEMLILCAVCSIMAGEDSFTGIAEYTENNIDRLSQYVEFPKDRVPSHDIFRWIFDLIDPEELENWIISLTKKMIDAENLTISHVAIDGKTIRNSKDKLHLVHAFCTQNRLFLCQEKVDEKTNEITVIPKILDLLDLKGLVITMDAMGCQREICSKIIEGEGDYLIAVKGNQKNLFEDIQDHFRMDHEAHEKAVYKDWDKGHGRLEERVYTIIRADEWLLEEHKWPGLKYIVCVQNTFQRKGNKTFETRFYITSLHAKDEIIAKIIRDHWRVENSLHYVLDVTFNEDKACIRNENAAINMSILRKLAINVLQYSKSEKQSMKSMLRKCSNPLTAIPFLLKFYHS